jgi:hypothetical protein
MYLRNIHNRTRFPFIGGSERAHYTANARAMADYLDQFSREQEQRHGGLGCYGVGKRGHRVQPCKQPNTTFTRFVWRTNPSAAGLGRMRVYVTTQSFWNANILTFSLLVSFLVLLSVGITELECACMTR